MELRSLLCGIRGLRRVVKTELVRPEQMTGSYELCMLIDGVVKQFPTATAESDTPFYKGHAKAQCMDHAVQELIIGNIPGLDPWVKPA